MKYGQEFQKVVQLICAERRDIYGIILFALLVGLLSLGVPLAVQAIVNSIALGGLTQQLLVLSILVFGVLAFSSGFRLIQEYAAEKIQRRLFARLTLNAVEMFPLLGDNRHALQSRANVFLEISSIQTALGALLLGAVGAFFQICVGLILLAFYHPVLLGFSLLVVFVAGGAIFGLASRGLRSATGECVAKYRVLDWLEDVARDPDLFRGSYTNAFALSKAQSLVNDWIGQRSTHFHVWFTQNLGLAALQVVSGTALLAVGGYLVIQGQLSLGQLVAAELVMWTALRGLSRVGKYLEYFYDLGASSAKVWQMFEGGRPVHAGKHLPILPSSDYDGLRVEHLHAAPTKVGFILTDISFSVPCGETLAVFGTNRSGKGLLADCIAGHQPFSYGRILINGHNVPDLDPRSLAAAAWLVRKTVLFHGTLEENLTLGRKSIDPRVVGELLEQLHLSELLRAMPSGLATQMAPFDPRIGGNELSSIGLARALLAQPQLLILDQTLDSFEESFITSVRAFLAENLPGTTTLVLTEEPQVLENFCNKFLLQSRNLLALGERTHELTFPKLLKEDKESHAPGS